MALDFNQRSFTKSVDQAAIDEGLRAYMLKVYNYMTTGLILTGFIAYFFGKASVEAYLPNGVALTPLGNILFNSGLAWIIMLAPLGFVFYLSARIHKMSSSSAQITFWLFVNYLNNLKGNFYSHAHLSISYLRKLFLLYIRLYFYQNQ